MKIQPQDLRIGNWVYESKISQFPMQVVNIGTDYIYLDFEGNEGDVWEPNIEDIEPIPLTEELLLKCGFEVLYGLKGIERIKEPIGVYINLIDMGYKKVSIDYSFSNFNTKEYSMVLNTSSEGMYTEFKLNIQYLNQLQNLFHALTGTELEIKL